MGFDWIGFPRQLLAKPCALSPNHAVNPENPQFLSQRHVACAIAETAAARPSTKGLIFGGGSAGFSAEVVQLLWENGDSDGFDVVNTIISLDWGCFISGFTMVYLAGVPPMHQNAALEDCFLAMDILGYSMI